MNSDDEFDVRNRELSDATKLACVVWFATKVLSSAVYGEVDKGEALDLIAYLHHTLPVFPDSAITDELINKLFGPVTGEK